mmetsp:Transcript_27271/g.53310  ORF Transcript_27271/g.53310 Transcript_27271/m.53310 type:complete len:202 (+) Transcript_27271:225-830(+)
MTAILRMLQRETIVEEAAGVQIHRAANSIVRKICLPSSKKVSAMVLPHAASACSLRMNLVFHRKLLPIRIGSLGTMKLSGAISAVRATAIARQKTVLNKTCICIWTVILVKRNFKSAATAPAAAAAAAAAVSCVPPEIFVKTRNDDQNWRLSSFPSMLLSLVRNTCCWSPVTSSNASALKSAAGSLVSVGGGVATFPAVWT